MEFNALTITVVVILIVIGIVAGYFVSNHINKEKALLKALTKVTRVKGSEFNYVSHVKPKHQPGTITVTALCIYSGGALVLCQVYNFHIDGPATIETMKQGGKLSIEFDPSSGIFFLKDTANKLGYAGSVAQDS